MLTATKFPHSWWPQASQHPTGCPTLRHWHLQQHQCDKGSIFQFSSQIFIVEYSTFLVSGERAHSAMMPLRRSSSSLFGETRGPMQRTIQFSHSWWSQALVLRSHLSHQKHLEQYQTERSFIFLSKNLSFVKSVGESLLLEQAHSNISSLLRGSGRTSLKSCDVRQ